MRGRDRPPSINTKGTYLVGCLDPEQSFYGTCVDKSHIFDYLVEDTEDSQPFLQTRAENKVIL